MITRAALTLACLLAATSMLSAGPYSNGPFPAQQPTQATAPFAGYPNYAQVNPQYRWGWFGAEHFYPTVQWHRDINGDTIRWDKQRRY